MVRLSAVPAVSALLLVAAGAGCADKPNTETFRGLTPPISEHREASLATSKKLDLGDDCGASGASSCASGVCFESAPKQYHCSQRCAQDSDCKGNNWECAQVYPSESGWYCVKATGTKTHRTLADAGR